MIKFTYTLLLLSILFQKSCQKTTNMGTSDETNISLFTGKQWLFDSVFINYTGPGTGMLIYARNGKENQIDLNDSRMVYWADGNEDVFDFPGIGEYAKQPWRFVPNDNNLIYYPPTSFRSTKVYQRIINITRSRAVIFDSTSRALDILVLKQ